MRYCLEERGRTRTHEATAMMSPFYTYASYTQRGSISSSLMLLDTDGSARSYLEWASLNGSRVGGRRNEDGLLVVMHEQTLLLGIFDGVSPLASAKVKNGGYFASKHAIMGISEAFARGERDPSTLLLRGNDAVREISITLEIDLSDYTQLVGSTATLALLDLADRTMHYAHVGDSLLALKCSGEDWARLTSDKVAQYEDRAINLARAANPDNPGITFADPSSDAVKMLRENRSHQNEPGGSGYGVINGHDNERLAAYIEAGEHPAGLDAVESLVLCTDGAMLPDR